MITQHVQLVYHNACRVVLLAVALYGLCGCQFAWLNRAENIDPVLSTEITRDQLVEHINMQHQGLEGWKSSSATMWVKMPRVVVPPLHGSIACRAPHYFRLTAENLVSEADLGSNAERCWIWVKPGPEELATWKHHDTKLLQHAQTGLPSIDPNWLMVVLGVKPLNPEDYQLVKGPTGSGELWLIAVEDRPSGRPQRNIIKVDTVRGVVIEHRIEDSHSNILVSAHLSEHRTQNNHRIPTRVALEFPQVRTKISLSFNKIETNPTLPAGVWQLPSRGSTVIDIGDIARQHMGYPPHQESIAPPEFEVPPEFEQLSEDPLSTSARQRAIAPSTGIQTTGLTEDFSGSDFGAEPEWDQNAEFGEEPEWDAAVTPALHEEEVRFE